MGASKVEVVVLGLLAEEPRYGYQLLDRFRERGMGLWVAVGRASVYQTLRRLEREGLVAGRTQEGSDGPDRRVFRITRAGRQHLTAALLAHVGTRQPFETDGGLALGFAHLLSSADARRAVDAREASVRELLDAVARERARTAADRGAARTVANAMLDRQEALAHAEIAWITRFRSRLARGRR